MPEIPFFKFLDKINKGQEKDSYPFNVLYGYNEFLGERLIEAFCKTFIETKSDFNFRRFYFDSDEGAGWEAVINEANSASFFIQSRKIIVATLREEKYLTLSKYDKELLKQYAKKPNPNTIFIVYVSLNLIKDDYKQVRRVKIARWIKDFASPHACFVDMDKIYEREIRGYIQSYLRAGGSKITAEALDKIFEIKDEDFVSVLYQLPRLIIADSEGRGLDSEDVEKVITGVEAHSIWDLTDAIEAENTGKYLRVLKYLFMNGIGPTLIIGTLITHYNKLYIAKFLLKHHVPVKEIGTLLGQHSFFLDKFIRTARGFSDKRLRHIVKMIYHLDYQSKTSGEESARLSLQSFAFRIKFMKA